jgi:hypothetical protein
MRNREKHAEGRRRCALSRIVQPARRWQPPRALDRVVEQAFSSVPLANALQIVALRTPTTARVIEEVVNRLVDEPPFSSVPLAHKLRLLCLNNPRLGRMFEEAMNAVMLEARQMRTKG